MANTPNIRFKGFSDEWEERKVGDVLTESREIGHKGDKARKMTVKLWGKGVNEKNEIGSENTQYYIRHSGQFIYSKLDFLNAAFGVVPEELEGLETTADVPAFDCNGINPYFMFYKAIQPDFFMKYGTIADGSRKAKRIQINTFFDMPLSLPSVQEQDKIVDLLHNIDNLITLHQRKCDETKELKKYMLQKMFPKKGEKIPEIRFAGFTDDWEEYMLSDVAELTSSKRVHAEDYVECGIPFFRGKEISELREHEQVSEVLYITEEKYNELSKLYGSPIEGDLLITAVGTIGNTWVVDQLPFYFKDGNLIWFRNIKCNSKYLNYVLNTPDGQKKIMASAIGSNQKALTMIKLNELSFMFPESVEQERISSYFTNLDSLITHHQRKCDQLKELKKFMLQNMFPQKG